jgi:hypothetical protein
LSQFDALGSVPIPPFALAQLDVSRRDQLERISQAGLVRSGRVFVLSLEPLKAAMGDRWAAKAELVWETVERALVKKMPAPDQFIRLDPTHVLAAVASTDAYQGQVRCAEVLRSILAFFLGRSVEADVQMSRVSDLSGSGLTAEPVDLTAAPPISAVEGRAPVAGGGVPPHRWTPPLAGRRLFAPFVGDDSVTVPLRFDVVPVWRLDQGAISAFALRRHLPQRIETYGDNDRLKMDHKVVDQMLPLLDEYVANGGVFALIVPGTFTSAAARRTRMDLVSRCAEHIDLMRQVVVMEIDGFEKGVPTGRIRETAAMMKPFFRVLTACVRSEAEQRAAIADFAFAGMAIDAASVPESRLDGLVRAARSRTPNVLVHNVACAEHEERLHAHGATHLTFREGVERG